MSELLNVSSSDSARSGSPGSPADFMLQTWSSRPSSAPKLTRTSTQKVRTGCVTCKKRHVKCDEGRPHCGNCLRSGKPCEGYAIKPRRARLGQISWDSRELVRSASPVMQLQLDPDLLDFRDGASLRYFNEFISLARGPWTNATSGGEVWGVTLPQLGRSSDTLRYAAMAIGALSIWHGQSTHTSLRLLTVPETPASEVDEHYFRAIAYYGQCLRMQRERDSVQDAVFLSVLLLFFELLRGNRKAALGHINHGMNMLLTLLVDKDASPLAEKVAPSPKPLLRGVADIFSQLAAQSRTILPGRFGDGPTFPDLYRGLNTRRQTLESFMVFLTDVARSSPAAPVPAVLNNLDEMEQCWTILLRGQNAITMILLEMVKKSGVVGCTDEDVIAQFHTSLLDNPQVLAFYANMKKDMESLDASFRPLFNRIIMSKPDTPEYLRAIHLRLKYLSLYIFENPRQTLDIEVLTSQTPLFREYLSLAEVALRMVKRDAKNPAYQYTMQCGMVTYLMIVSWFCRDPLVRDQAISILREYPGHDGTWNTHSVYLLACRNRELELVNATEGTAAEQWQRLWRREFLFENGGDRILFRFLAKDSETGKWKMVEEATELSEGQQDVVWKRQPLTGSGGLLYADLFFSSGQWGSE